MSETTAATASTYPRPRTFPAVAPPLCRSHSQPRSPSSLSSASSSASSPWNYPFIQPSDWDPSARRERASSVSSWAGSMGMDCTPSNPSLSPDVDEPPGKAYFARPPAQSHGSSDSVSSAGSMGLPTPEAHSADADIDIDNNALAVGTPPQVRTGLAGQASPAGSTISSIASKGENTPRAELPPPVWPLSGANSDVKTEIIRRDSPLKRAGSWRKKHASLDNPAVVPAPTVALQNFATGLRDTPPFRLPPDLPTRAPRTRASTPPSEPCQPKALPAGDRRLSMSAAQGPATARIITRSSATGCYISAPISPPIGYPLPAASPGLSSAIKSPTLSLDTPRSSTRSSSSASSGSSGQRGAELPPPRWAQPPARTTAVVGRAKSAGPEPEVDADFDPDLFNGTDGEWIEVIKGEEGRIAVKSTVAQYEVMVWLPGFSLDDITITTRKHQTLHIVADQWDEADHAQWEIKLGDDAIMSSIRADFDKRKLTVRISRSPTAKSIRAPSFRTESTSSSTWSTANQPSIASSDEADTADVPRGHLAHAATVQQQSVNAKQAAHSLGTLTQGLGMGMDAGEEWRMEARMSRG
ncbi:hypothetical protein Q5752_004718 [Cryptotrichosporon argae]